MQQKRIKVILSRQELAAALLFASTDETRYIINGLLIEYDGETPLIVATDGRRLAAIKSIASQEKDEPGEAGSFVLRADFAKAIIQIVKAFGGTIMPWFSIETKAGSTQVSVEHIGGGFSLQCSDNALVVGEFPNWRQACPPRTRKREPVADLALNGEFVGDFAKAAKLLGSKQPLVQMSLVGKLGAVEVSLAGVQSFYGVIMQCHPDQNVEYQPEFVSIIKDFPVADEEEEEND